MTTTIQGRTPLKLTAEEAATRTYKAVALKPENWLKTEIEIRDIAAHLLTRFIKSGLFIITN